MWGGEHVPLGSSVQGLGHSPTGLSPQLCRFPGAVTGVRGARRPQNNREPQTRDFGPSEKQQPGHSRPKELSLIAAALA